MLAVQLTRVTGCAASLLVLTRFLDAPTTGRLALCAALLAGGLLAYEAAGYTLPFAVLVVLAPGTSVATTEAYGWIDGKLTKAAAAQKLWVPCARSWSLEDADLLNDFEAVVFSRYPSLRQIKRRLLQAGAAGAALAGSGSAVFGLFQNPAQARRAAQQFLDEQGFIARTLTRAEFRRSGGWRA